MKHNDTTQNREISFVARRYRSNAFSKKDAWKSMGLGNTTLRWSPIKIAAAVALLTVITATATIIIRQEYFSADSNVTEQNAVIGHETLTPEVKAIDFDNAPLPMVIEKIKSTYGVDVDNMPKNAEEYRLTLHFEGTAADLLATINEILDTDLTLKK